MMKLLPVKPGKSYKIDLPGSKVRLTAKQENFCRLYTDLTSPETFNQPGICYKLAGYSTKCTDKNLTAAARYMLRNKDIKKRLLELLEAQGLNDFTVDGQLLRVLKQDKDLSNKMAAIKEYNKIRRRAKDNQGPTSITVEIIDFSRSCLSSGGG